MKLLLSLTHVPCMWLCALCLTATLMASPTLDQCSATERRMQDYGMRWRSCTSRCGISALALPATWTTLDGKETGVGCCTLEQQGITTLTLETHFVSRSEKAARSWLGLLHASKADRLLSRVQHKLDVTTAAKQDLEDTMKSQSMQAILRRFGGLTLEDQRLCMTLLTSQSTHMWQDLAHDMLLKLDANSAAQLMVKVMDERDDFTVDAHMPTVMRGLVACQSVTKAEDGRYKLLSALLAATESMGDAYSGENVLPRLVAFAGVKLGALRGLIVEERADLEALLDSLDSDERQTLVELMLISERRVREQASDEEKAALAMKEQFTGIRNGMTFVERLAFLREMVTNYGDEGLALCTQMHEDEQAIGLVLKVQDEAKLTLFYHTILAKVDPAILVPLIPPHLLAQEEEVEEAPVKKKKKRIRKHKKSGMFVVDTPFGKFMRPISKQNMARVVKSKVLTVLYDMYEKKVTTDDAFFNHSLPCRVPPLADFTKTFLIRKFGLPSIRDDYLFQVVDCVRKFGSISSRVAMFGTMVGVLHKEQYSPRISYVIMALYREMFTKFSSVKLRRHKEGQLYVTVAKAIKAVESVFVTYHMCFSSDRQTVSPGMTKQRSCCAAGNT